MDDSLVDIDEALLSDSFSAPNDESFEDVNAIVQQWKLNASDDGDVDGDDCNPAATAAPQLLHHTNDAADKFLNTRTFTRPKRRVFAKCTPSLFAATPQATAGAASSSPPRQQQHHINLRIGGLVSAPNGGAPATPFGSMQRSFLGDVSPPSSMCSTSFSATPAAAAAVGPMAASLISSNDFSGMNAYMLESGRDQPGFAVDVFETSRPQVFDDISMLTAAYESRADADAEPGTLNEPVLSNGGDALTAAPADDTFERLKIRAFGSADTTAAAAVAAPNETMPFDTTHSTMTTTQNNTTTKADAANVLDATYEQDTSVNRTLIVMDARQPLNVTVDAVPSVLTEGERVNETMAIATEAEATETPVEAGEGDLWGRTLNDTFQLEQIQLDADNTFDMMASAQLPQQPPSEYSIRVGEMAQLERDYGLQSTPNKTTSHLFAPSATDTPPTAPPQLLNDPALFISPIHTASAAPHPNPTLITSTVDRKFNTYVRPKPSGVRPSLASAAFALQAPMSMVAAAAADDDDVDVDDDVLNDLPSPPVDFELRGPHTNARRDHDERQSLQNFEEFEKSLSLCKSDTDFDVMLNGLAEKHAGAAAAHQQQQQQQRSTESSMRQSLDNIKKRHSLLNLEKQLEDQQLRRNAAAANESTTQPPPAGDSNRMLSSSAMLAMGRSGLLASALSSSQTSLLSGSGSGERLLRRSRIIDDVIHVHQPMDRSAGASSTSSQTSSTMSDSKENVDSNRQQQQLQPSLAAAAATTATAASSAADGFSSGGENAAAAGETGQKVSGLKPRSIPNNRDRFKTMRITKRPTDLAVPHITDDSVDVDDEFASSGGDSEPQHLSLAPDSNRDRQPAPVSLMAPRSLQRRTLQRPSAQLGGSGLLAPQQPQQQQRRDASLTITRNMAQPQTYGAPAQQAAKQMVSPMGTKAKSIGHLASAIAAEKSADETNARSQKEQQRSADPVFKIPSGLRAPHQRSSLAAPRASGLQRPASGFGFGYGSGARRTQQQPSQQQQQHTDSDTESGRMSPTNSLSSASSKGSLYRLGGGGGTETPPVHSSTDDVTAQATAAATTTVVEQPKSALPKRSGLQPPTAVGAFAARKRSGLPRPMSMAANR